MSSTVRDRCAAATGALYVVLVIVGNELYTRGTHQSAHPSGDQVLADARHIASSSMAHVGFAMEGLGFVALVAFLGYLGDVLIRRRREQVASNVAAVIAMVAGITGVAIKLGSAVPTAALMFDHKTLSPELAQLLNDMSTVGWVLSWLPFVIFVAAGGWALHRCSLVGKPTAYVALVIGVVGIPLAVLGLEDLANLNPIAFLLGLLWTLVVSIRLAVRPGVVRASEPYDATVSTGMPVGAAN
ncbi:MAG TPA: hypothetical protein VH419_13245 [Nocardioidaceae bacterium]|jgi:hypothetical protein